VLRTEVTARTGGSFAAGKTNGAATRDAAKNNKAGFPAWINNSFAASQVSQSSLKIKNKKSPNFTAKLRLSREIRA